MFSYVGDFVANRKFISQIIPIFGAKKNISWNGGKTESAVGWSADNEPIWVAIEQLGKNYKWNIRTGIRQRDDDKSCEPYTYWAF